MSVKECTHHKYRRQKLIGKLCAAFLILVVVVLLTFLITWAILQPKKPRFTLQDANHTSSLKRGLHKPNLPPTAVNMSVKECTHHKYRRQKLIGKLCAAFLILVVLVLLTFLITWAILQPKKPRFTLQDATIYAFNISGPNTILLSSNFQVTVSSRNPNSRIGIYYDKLNIFATYNHQQVTYYTGIPPVYQGHKETNVWSPFVYGTNIPVAPYNGDNLKEDQSDGEIFLLIKLNGRVRWRVGRFISGRYHIHVTCPANIPFGDKQKSLSPGIVVGTGIKYQLSQRCKVNV